MARALIVGCGCRGRALSAALVKVGHAVRGSTRDERRLGAIEAAGAEPILADPDRLETLVPHIERVSVLCWLMGTAEGDADRVAALHGARLRSLLEALVDTPVRGVVYEAAGSVPRTSLDTGAEVAGEVGRTFRMPIETLTADPADHDAWLPQAVASVERALSR